MTTLIINEITPIPETAPNYFIYLIGLSIYVLTIIADIAQGQIRKRGWYIAELMYTLISIIGGIFVSFAFNCSEAITYVIVIGMGLFGSSIIRKLIQRENEITDSVADRIATRITGDKHKHNKHKEEHKEEPQQTKPQKPPTKIELTKEDEDYINNL
jgi:uncharacterized membrane protein YiaA